MLFGWEPDVSETCIRGKYTDGIEVCPVPTVRYRLDDQGQWIVDDDIGAGMMISMGLICLLVGIALVLVIAALIRDSRKP